MIDKGICDKWFIWNPSNCEFECNKLCDVWEYLYYGNCKCRERLVDKLVQEYSENIDEKELNTNELISVTSNYYKSVRRSCERSSCTIYIILLTIFFIISISISCAFVYFHWYLKKGNTGVTNINPSIETVIYWMQLHWTRKWEISNK